MPKFNSLNVSTIREFDGGWNTVNSDLNMSTKYSKIEDNMFYGISGSKQKRYGTKYFTNVKTFPVIYETYTNNCNVEETKTITIPQDTAHNVDVDDVITIANPQELAGSYTVTANYYTKFVVNVDTSPTQKSFTDITYECNGVSQVAKSVEVIENKLYFTRNTNPLVTRDVDIEILSPSNYAGTRHVIYADGDSIQIDVTGTTHSASDVEIKYKYTKLNNVYEKVGTTTAKDTKTALVFNHLNADLNKLITGHKLHVISPASLSDNYVVFYSDDEVYKVDITGKSYSDVNNISISHDNRNIQGDRLIDATYFLNRLIAVSDIGEVVAIDGQGNSIIIFNEQIAASNNMSEEAQYGWGITTQVCFAVFNGKLTLWNGRNKPLVVDLLNNVPCNFLVDEATQTNSKIPIAKYAIGINHYMVIGNCYNEETKTWNSDRIYISDYDTIATFNDGSESYLENGGIYVDVGKIVSTSVNEIKGLSRYRTQLIISFDEVSVFGTLGGTIDAKTTDDVEYKLHKPDFSDVINDFGCVGNRTFQTILGDVVCLSYDGVGLFRKQVLSSLTTSAKLSTIIGNELYKSYKDLNGTSLTERIWSVYNPKEQQYMLFIPNSEEYETTIETTCFVYTVPSAASLSKATSGAWSKFSGWNFQWGCTSALNEVFFGNGSKIYVLGNSDREFFADFVDDPDYPADEETGLSGKEIKFTWEFGWQDFNNRVAKKTLRYIGITSTGTANFTFGTWYDYLQDEECEMKIDLVGGDANGYGRGRQRYGGGRRTNTELLFAYTGKFNLIKIRIYGISKEDLKISGISLHYLIGGMRR